MDGVRVSQRDVEGKVSYVCLRKWKRRVSYEVGK